MTQVVLIRPGATLYDEQNRIQGVLDVPLSERGYTQVAALVSQIAALPIAALYHGPGESIERTADAIAKSLRLRPKRLDDFHNLDQGLWQGLQVGEVRRRNPKVFRQWLDDPRTICPPQGEPVEDALVRIKTTLKPLIRRHRGEMLGLVVPHPLAQLVSAFLRRADRVQFDDEAPNCGFERIEVSIDALRNGDGH